MPSRMSAVAALLLLVGCAAPTSRPVAEITEEDLKGNALLFGSIWRPDDDYRYGRKYFGSSTDGETKLIITGDEATAVSGPSGIGEIRLFMQLVEPGEYRFSPYGSAVFNDREVGEGEVEAFGAGQIVYMGQLLCVNVWFSCRWITVDQLGRDLYYASEAKPDLPWMHTVFRGMDASSTALDFRSQHVKLMPLGPATHRGSRVAFPEKSGGFERQYVETYGGNNAGAVYENEPLDVEAQVLMYRMNVVADEASEKGLSGRLREVVLAREANLALLAYLRDNAFDDTDAPPATNAEIAMLMREDGLRAGRRLDGVRVKDARHEHVRFYIFSEQGWLIRYRFRWSDPVDAATPAMLADAGKEYEDAFTAFMLNQEWPAGIDAEETIGERR